MAFTDGWTARTVHRFLAPVLALLLSFLAVTGTLWTILAKWAGMPKAQTHIFMALHEVDVLGLDYVYPPLVAVVSVVFFITGLKLTRLVLKGHLPTLAEWQDADGSRQIHQLMALVAFLPLLFAAITGALYAVCRKWFGIEKAKVHWIIELHNMEIIYLGGFYPLVLAALALTMAFTGIPLTPLWRNLISKLPGRRREEGVGYGMMGRDMDDGEEEGPEFEQMDMETDDVRL